MIKSADTTVFTVSQLNQLVGDLLGDAFPLVWIEGEISNLVQPASQHLYFSLKDAKSQVRCAMFRAHNCKLPFKPENGQHVLVYAKIGLYAPRGDFQLVVESMEPAGEGKLRLQFEQLKLRLSQEGLFDAQFKKAIPTHPQKLGVITSSTGAAIQDILTVLKRRAPYLSVIVYPTLVQGEQAAAQICEAIQIANSRAECDVLILARGGGSLEDLWPFNEESVARAIFASQLPIVTGVGHEIDFTIADWVADVRAPTPSAAAELVSSDMQTLQKQLILFERKILEHTERMISRAQEQLTSLAKRLKHPKKQLQEWSQKIDDLNVMMVRLMTQLLKHNRQTIHELGRLLDTISPLATLNRGYAIARQENKTVVKTAVQVHTGESLEILLGEGTLQCEVMQIVMTLS